MATDQSSEEELTQSLIRLTTALIATGKGRAEVEEHLRAIGLDQNAASALFSGVHAARRTAQVDRKPLTVSDYGSVLTGQVVLVAIGALFYWGVSGVIRGSGDEGLARSDMFLLGALAVIGTTFWLTALAQFRHLIPNHEPNSAEAHLGIFRNQVLLVAFGALAFWALHYFLMDERSNFGSGSGVVDSIVLTILASIGVSCLASALATFKCYGQIR